MENKTVSHIPDFDKPATVANIRSYYGSVAEACRRFEVERRTFDAALNGERGRRRANSIAAQVIRRLDDQGLLVKKPA
ncbi:hypothetical protein [Syntrophotalea acetylenica]|uniref:Uncharacterized protein n=1 Tax=Syntrophotalea acetylenica TaxID=29542 RepID=A0A1L3GDP3_SYNAC|nr:hypothetical protein [Syntrophotalea acetylenica]APG24072.1 hypothetical protein A7E75_02790 [Syntrophotalea acetylenica]APG44654.1 hypothetical protein A6070_11415 [Syntrophotalea acetylenica]